MPSTLSSAATKCISDVPGFVKHTFTPPPTSVRTRLSAPFMVVPSCCMLFPVAHAQAHALYRRGIVVKSPDEHNSRAERGGKQPVWRNSQLASALCRGNREPTLDIIGLKQS